MGIIPILCFLLVFNTAFAQEDCFAACESKFDNQAKNEGCKEGCRLAVIFAIAYSSEGTESVRERCENGCVKSYDKLSAAGNLKEACQAGCQSQPLPNHSNVHISIAAGDPIFEVASDAMSNRIHSSLFNFPEFGNGYSDIEDAMNQMRTMRERMLERFGAMGRMRNVYPEASNDVAVHRPNGHLSSSFEGPQVGNKDSNGLGIINSRPVERPKMQLTIFPAYRESYRVSRYQDPDEMASFVERLSQRARRMSILSQWLICLALLLCLLSMVGISLAIIRQIKLQRRLRARHTHMIIPTTIGQPLPAKKVPLESPAAAMDYPLIHDTPPPAYDQLSVHKAKLQQDQQP